MISKVPQYTEGKQYSPRSISKRGFSFSPASGRIRTCCVSTRSSPWNVEKMMPYGSSVHLHHWNISKIHILEFFFLLPPKSLCRRLSNHPRNSTGSPCCSKRKLPTLARFTSCRNSWGLTWLLNKRGFQSFLANPANLFSSSDSFPWKLESRR